MTTITNITLVDTLTPHQRAILVRYATRPRSIRSSEWREALGAFDAMGSSTLSVEGRSYTFSTFYAEFIDNHYANHFLKALLAATDVESEGFRLLAGYNDRVLADLQQAGVRPTGDVSERCLIAFCHYWWTSFGKGYIREVVVFRDLTTSGITFEGHDLIDRRQRRLPYDLTISGWHGDIKTSTYFLHIRRSFPLQHDFYIVLLYDETTQQRLSIVMVKPSMWERINGKTIPCELQDVAHYFPHPARVSIRGESLIVVGFHEWKERVLRFQQRKEEQS